MSRSTTAFSRVPIPYEHPTHRYRVTPFGLRTAMFLSRTWSQLLRPGLSLLAPQVPDHGAHLRILFNKLDQAIDQFAAQQKAA